MNMFLILFQPKHWCSNFKQSHPHLRPNFIFTELHPVAKREAAYFIFGSLLLSPIISVLIVVFLLLVLGEPWKYIQLAAVAAFSWHFFTSLLFGLLISVSVGRIIGLIGGVFCGLILGGLQTGILAIFIIALFNLGVAGSLLPKLAEQTNRASLWRHIVGVGLGLIVCGSILFLGYFIAISLIPDFPSLWSVDYFDWQLFAKPQLF